MNRITLRICRVLAVAVIPSISFAADRPTTKPAPPREQTITEPYDIRDLLHSPRDYAAPTSLIPPTEMGHDGPGLFSGSPHPSNNGGGGGGPFGSPAGAASMTLSDQMIKLLEETIDPASWRDNGGNEGSLHEFSGQLIVTQTAENQKALAGLLAQLRESAVRLITVRAHWVGLEPGQMEAMTTPTRQAGAGDAAILVVDQAALNKLDAKTLHYRAQTTCFDGQTVRVASGQARTVVTEVTPVVGNATTAYQPTAPLIQAGATIELTPRLTPDRESAIIDVSSVVSDWSAIEPASVKPTTQPANIAAPDDVDRLRMLAQHLRCTVVVPVGKSIVVGGMTLDPSSTGGDARQLYLILEVVGAAK